MSETQSESQRRRVGTGVSGLDYILNGGLPANHLYLIEGHPGTGKTTLGMQFLLEGKRLGESVLFVTLSETGSELRTVAESHGWSLDGVGLFELGALEERLHADEQYTVFHPAEVELSETTKRICEQVDKLQPSRVVFDSLSEVRLLARDPLRYRRQVLALKQFFAGRKCTVMLLDDRSSIHPDLQLQTLCHGVLQLEKMSVEYSGTRRQLSVSKIRGLQYREGRHDFCIQPGGLLVFPRLIASHTETSARLPLDAPRKQARSGIGELDQLLGGGIDYGTSTLMMGPAGTGKSTLTTQFALHLAENGDNVICYLFEETRENFLQRAKGLGIKLANHLESGRITVEQVDAAEMSPGEFVFNIRNVVDSGKAQVVVIDSLNGYMNAMPNPAFLMIQIHELLVYLNERGVLTMIVLAQQGMLGTGMDAPVDVTYLADTVVLLRYFEAFGEVKQAIAVIKKRTGGHERSIREMQLKPQGISIGPPLKEFEGVLTGVPRYRGKQKSLISNDRD